MENTDKSKVIATLNDRLRKLGLGGQLMMTSGIQTLEQSLQMRIMQAVMSFKEFTEDNDPHQEHDFGMVQIDQTKVFWKIDYYDLKMEYGSEDPSDPAQTKRVLTVMLAEEY